MHETFSIVTEAGSTRHLSSKLIAITSSTDSSTWSAIRAKVRRTREPRANLARPAPSPRKVSALRMSARTKRLPLTMLVRRLPVKNLLKKECLSLCAQSKRSSVNLIHATFD